MKLVVFAHTPPPLHGQSYMVKLMIDGLGGDRRGKSERVKEKCQATGRFPIECFHVNAQFSGDLADVGLFQVQKIFRLIRYCLEAIWCRFRYNARVLYYVPAPPKRVAFYRDCFVLLLCRSFFRRSIFHWEASGLAEWLQREAFPWERWIGQWLLGSPDLSIILATALSNDAIYFQSIRIHITPNAIPDPCPDFEKSILPYRMARLARRREMFEKKGAPVSNAAKYCVAFLAHCTREKGLFVVLDAIALANQRLEAQMLPLRMELTVAGAFVRESERQEFGSWQQAHPDNVNYVGFLSGDSKARLLRDSDCLCFPTHYPAEAQPVSVIEAMAFGLTVVASVWRGIPELLPKNYPLLIPERDASTVSQALVESMLVDRAKELRLRYCEAFTEKRYLESITHALQLVCSP